MEVTAPQQPVTLFLFFLFLFTIGWKGLAVAFTHVLKPMPQQINLLQLLPLSSEFLKGFSLLVFCNVAVRCGENALFLSFQSASFSGRGNKRKILSFCCCLKDSENPKSLRKLTSSNNIKQTNKNSISMLVLSFQHVPEM